MASKGYTIAVATDSRLFEQGVRMGIIKPVEEADDALTDLGKNRGLDELTDDLKDAQRATDKLGDEARDAAKQMQADYRRTGQAARDAAGDADGFGHAGTRGMRDVSEATAETADEFRGNLGEAISSFRGDLSDLVQIGQDTLGGLAGSGALGGIPGLFVLAAGAAGVGLLQGAIEKGQEKTEEWKAAVGELAQAFIDAGGDNTTAGVQRSVDKLKALATATDDVKLTDLRKDAESANVSFEKLARTWGGSEKDLRDLWRQVDGTNDSLWEQIRAAQQRGDANLEEKLRGEARATLELRQQIGQQIGVTHEATDAYKAWVAAGGPELQAKADALQSFADSVKSSLSDAGSAWEDYNQDGTTSLDEYNAHIEEQIKSINSYQENVKAISASVSQDALNYILSLGTDAAPIIQAFVDAPLDQQQRTAANWDSLGKQSSSAYKSALQNDLANSVVSGPKVVIDDVDTSRIPGLIQQTLNGHKFEVPVWANPRVGNAVQ